MVSPAASALTPSYFPIGSTKSRISQPHNSILINVRKQHASVRCSAKFPGMEHFNEPEKLFVFLNSAKDKVWENIPDSVKQFPWQKAEDVALHKLFVLGKETLKWSSLACLMTKYLDEVSQEFMHDDKDGGITRRLLGISCFFVLVKVISTYLLRGNDFLLHAANGGLMQVLWNWKESPKLDVEESSMEDAQPHEC